MEELRKLCEWADKYHISEEALPRDEAKLRALTSLKVDYVFVTELPPLHRRIE